ncbi:MAG: hypothetical protein UMU75_04230 [Halomonas sp.]|nr:hypothetical protein [Halomonas sp.]
METMMLRDSLLRYWYGQQPLWKAYWIVGIAGTAVFLALLALLLGVPPLMPLAQATLAAFVLYTAFAIVVTWRCAKNTTRPRWGAIAQALIAAWALNVLLLAVFTGLDLLAR